MTRLIDNLSKGLTNKHLTIPLVLGIGLEIAAVWFPQYREQLTDTQKILIAYGLFAAANSGPENENKNTNTKPPAA